MTIRNFPSLEVIQGHWFLSLNSQYRYRISLFQYFILYHDVNTGIKRILSATEKLHIVDEVYCMKIILPVMAN